MARGTGTVARVHRLTSICYVAMSQNKKINADSTDLVDDDVDDDYSDEEMTIADLDEIENDSKEESGDNEVVKNFRASIINSVESRKKKREKEKVGPTEVVFVWRRKPNNANHG